MATRGLCLELNTTDLCFVIALYARARAAQLASFHPEQLEDVFAEVCTLTSDSTQLRKRATHAIGRLRDQRVLARIDGLGVVRAPEYALTRLGSSIAETLLEEDVLTRASLDVLTRTLRDALERIADAARRASEPTAWRDGVVDPLAVAVADLIAGIERRQRGLDQQQEQLQEQIRELLEADWFGAVERCQTILATTSATLRKLAELLLRDTHELGAVLHDIYELATTSGSEEAEHATVRVIEQLDRIAAWGSARQAAWSDYFEYVHRFLRDVVRLDPARALSQRLREQLAGSTARPFALAIAAAPRLRLLRDVELPSDERAPVSRPRSKREREPAAVATEDARAQLASRVRASLAEGARSLSAVTADVTADLPTEAHYGAAGRVAEAVAELRRPSPGREREWTAATEELLIEEWPLPGGEAGDPQ